MRSGLAGCADSFVHYFAVDYDAEAHFGSLKNYFVVGDYFVGSDCQLSQWLLNIPLQLF